MAITPQTSLRLIKVPLQLDNKNQLTFKNELEQMQYFLSLPHIEITEISYQRKDSFIMFPAHIDSILEYNYVMYLNENYTNKYFYAFITGMEYVNDFNTRISITTDVFQTWQFNLNFKESFIEREMINLNEDIPGANLIPEGLELGELKVQGTAGFDELEPAFVVAFSGEKYNEQPISHFGFEYNGIPSSVAFIITTNALNTVLNIINAQGDGDKILTVFSIPKLAVKSLLPNDPPRTNNLF